MNTRTWAWAVALVAIGVGAWVAACVGALAVGLTASAGDWLAAIGWVFFTLVCGSIAVYGFRLANARV